MESEDLIEIIEYNSQYQTAFQNLNKEWITQFFVMEGPDYKALDYPQEYILDKGGFILVALLNQIPVGVCAMIKMNDPEYDFEMAKMAVSPKAQGRKIGYTLGTQVLRKAVKLGAKKVYLESNRKLAPAINLYYKLGFKEVIDRKSPYARADILMAIDLTKSLQ